MKKTILTIAIVLASCAAAQAQSAQSGERSGKNRAGNAPTTQSAPAKKAYVPPPPQPTVVFKRGDHPYAQRHHRACQQKSYQLHSYERHAAADGYLSRRERRTIEALKRDLDRTCRGFRWRG